MINVLITGAGSYIGGKIAEYLSTTDFTVRVLIGETPSSAVWREIKTEYNVRELDVRGGVDETAFAGVDAVIHVAGIAHQMETPQNAELYHKVNCDLAVETAKIAKANGVKQFIFFSSMSVYGMTTGRITAQTQPAPNTHYGKSKWNAEQAMAELQDENFRIAVLRPPMIYGPGCRGNYPRLASFALKLPAFPAVDNERSMLYIGTLCAFVEKLLESGRSGLFFPQNSEYVNTTRLVKAVARCHGKKLLLIPGLGWMMRMLQNRVGVVGKVFGTLTYDRAMSKDFAHAGQLDFEETIRRTEDKQ